MRLVRVEPRNVYAFNFARHTFECPLCRRHHSFTMGRSRPRTSEAKPASIR
ncbi:MAG TPA: hypothetical protein VEM36_08800 [Xanthobacteraceae bacterium]|nr:hypothetical protein [Xanthobacteraceae bacterium]